MGVPVRRNPHRGHRYRNSQCARPGVRPTVLRPSHRHHDRTVHRPGQRVSRTGIRSDGAVGRSRVPLVAGDAAGLGGADDPGSPDLGGRGRPSPPNPGDVAARDRDCAVVGPPTPAVADRVGGHRFHGTAIAPGVLAHRLAADAISRSRAQRRGCWPDSHRPQSGEHRYCASCSHPRHPTTRSAPTRDRSRCRLGAWPGRSTRQRTPLRAVLGRSARTRAGRAAIVRTGRDEPSGARHRNRRTPVDHGPVRRIPDRRVRPHRHRTTPQCLRRLAGADRRTDGTHGRTRRVRVGGRTPAHHQRRTRRRPRRYRRRERAASS